MRRSNSLASALLAAAVEVFAAAVALRPRRRRAAGSAAVPASGPFVASQARLGAIWLLLAAVAVSGCAARDELDIRFTSLSPDPLVIDLDALNGETAVRLDIVFELIGNPESGSCAPVRFVSSLAGVGLAHPGYFGSTKCEDEGVFSTGLTLNLNVTSLRLEPSGNYSASIEIGRCIDSDLDPSPGEKDCVHSKRSFTIELRDAAAPAPPAAPQDLVATVDGQAVVLTWREDRHAQSYLLEVESGGGGVVTLATLPVFSTTFRDIAPALNTPLTYRLTARNDSGDSPPATASARIGVTRTLTVTLDARGSDSVISAPAGIDCPGDCSQSFPLNEVVVLTARASSVISDRPSEFLGWFGDTDCSDGSVTMDADKTCTAWFLSRDSRQLTLALAGSGSGRVGSDPAGIDCPGTCNALFGVRSLALLTATPDPGSVFVSWTGAAGCSSGAPTMDADKLCTATFALIAAAEQTLTVYVQGSGSVTSTPAGILCSSDAGCPARFARNQTVLLTATPDAGQAFLGWAGSADCADGQVTMTADLSCVATFVSTAAQWVTGAAALNQTSQFDSSSILEPAITVDAAGLPVVAWNENNDIYVYRPVRVGVTRANENPSNSPPSIVMQPGDEPALAFDEEVAGQKRNVRLRRYSAVLGAWTDVVAGPLDTTPGADAREPFVVLRNGRFTVAWIEGDAGSPSRVVVRAWDGTAWSDVGIGGGPPAGTSTESARPRLVVTGSPGTQGLALMWAEDPFTLRVAELVGDAWVLTASAPYPGGAQADRSDMMWTPDLGLVVASAAAANGSFVVRRWWQGQWLDLGAPRGDAGAGSFVLGLAFSHGASDATPLLAYAISRSRGAVTETVVERFIAAAWVRVGDPLPRIDRHRASGSPRAVAVADHATPEVAVVLRGTLPGTATTDHTLAVYRFE